MLIRDSLRITINSLHGGAAVQFPKDTTLISSFKARFPRARWGSGTRSWHIPGKLAAARAQIWAEEQSDYLGRLEMAARDAEWADQSKPSPRPAIRSIMWHAIPGQPSRRATAAPPSGDIERAVRAVEDLAQDTVRRVLWGFLSPPFGVWQIYPAGWETGYGDSTYMGFSTWHKLTGGTGTVHWRWQAVCGGDTWQTDGWMPDALWSNQALAGHRAKLWAAINPKLGIVI
ncbi:hypothetical protein [Rhodobacter capsulatus]|jgi:hypothetical protein|uniref:Conserved domain protein n=1 Tax=Rhodobacter capsulatus (strain ATCC BAA-309 / NBRC 16581 / SB1003) TaxID=272942 RepID=D5AQX1_RHOCB|nr:hypothetical protein [Rhodobacter capsulatus]YP_004934646.1 hypothetical protein RcapMu3 [Rhodobacter phage RcapMu]ADE84777.1 conserved domain protein [Rhodobacter capsulatus SB 1003]AER29926.1 hypothetical protein RcapMu3 [Rhodobacter phage RcapMu]ETD02247.1 hypothetical protein U714_06285 [Rhodobacter capsulatus DE442]ETD78330.1 hypothetical protein U717_06290 [Rhodobacter capsulatus R121]ETE54445.1 hypothetical protein U715_06280 [Rhodobacter capsulatus Y262]